MSPSETSSRGPGRPPGRTAERVRSELLAAAREHFTRREFRAVSLRELAHAAGVSVAMIRYYFGDKAGLYTAMVEESVGPLLDQLERHEIASLPAFLSRYIDLLSTNPWLPNLVVREVLYAEAGDFRKTFMRRFAGRLRPQLIKVLENERAAGHLRADLDLRLAALSLLSMAVFPFVARPLAGPLLDVEDDNDWAGRLLQHTQRLFYEGARGATEHR